LHCCLARSHTFSVSEISETPLGTFFMLAFPYCIVSHPVLPCGSRYPHAAHHLRVRLLLYGSASTLPCTCIVCSLVMCD
jgi:hypothetical protein